MPTASFGVALPVDPGDHVVEADASGHARRRWAINLSEGHAETVDIALGDGVDPGPGVALTSGPGESADGSSEPSSWWTTRRGLGVASLVLGTGAAVVTALFVARHNSGATDLRIACDPRCPEARRTELGATRDAAVRDQTLAITAGVLSGAALITGAVLVLWPTHKSGTATREVHVAASPAGVGPGIAGRF